MEHYYHTLGEEEWFDFQALYKEMVEKFPSGSAFVEVGSYKVKSSVFMAVEIINSGKDITLYCIDNWQLGQTREKFLENIFPVEEKITLLEGTSWEVARYLKDESIDFCFIDADHAYESVKKDILAYLPKMKKGGILAGHDYNPNPEPENGVAQAVHELLDRVEIRDVNKWVYYVR